MTIYRIIFVLLLLYCVPYRAFSALQSDAAQKAEVRAIVNEVQSISKRCRTLDEFGRKTIEQGKKVLSIGECAVYPLSTCLDDNTDWKVRFWIIDMLGYLENPDARRPLLRTINNAAEKEIVKQQAEKSLKRLSVPVEHNIQ